VAAGTLAVGDDLEHMGLSSPVAAS